jgi:outer membrane receptor protein involved in Fe transport
MWNFKAFSGMPRAKVAVVACSTVLALSNPAAAAAQANSVSGTVVDQSGAAVANAHVRLLSAANTEAARARTDEGGRFLFSGLTDATYIVIVEKTGFKELRTTVTASAAGTTPGEYVIEVAAPIDAVTVTPARGEAQEIFDTPEAVTIVSRNEISRRSFVVLPQALREEAGIHVQQTSRNQGSLFVRGLTGQQVVTLIDGVRFNNSTFRPGPNQYQALIDPYFIDRVEIVRGPNSSQYGSDSLGGTINVLTQPAGPFSGDLHLHGAATAFFGSADLSSGGSVLLTGGAADWAFAVEGNGARTQDLRPGGGIDSHSAVTRFLGISSKVLGNRLQDTAFTQYGASSKFVYRRSPRDLITIEYLRGAQLGARRYDQLDGGNGNLLNRFEPQIVDFLVGRYERLGLHPFDSLSFTFSYNGQRDDRSFQNVNNSDLGLRSKITDEKNRTDAYGYQAQATTHFGSRNSVVFGGEFYDEYISARRIERQFSQSTGDFSVLNDVRARYPNGARYKTIGIFAQDMATLIPNRLTGTVGIRYANFRYSQSPQKNPFATGGVPSVPPFETSVGDITFNTGAVLAVNDHLNLTASISRGFRAPNANDLGSIGLTSLGFEISPQEGEGLGAFIGGFASSEREEAEEAPSSGQPVQPLRSEHLINYELGLRLRTSRVGASMAVFDSEFRDFIERRVVVLAQGATGLLIGGQPIIHQDETGAVFTALSNTPVLVRANAGRVRFRGAEASVWLHLAPDLTLTANGFYLRASDLDTGRPPALEGGIPPATGFLSLQWEPTGRRFWLEGFSTLALAQKRLSDEDFEEARIGGIRDREEIANFFNNGAVARGLVRNGVLLATGETLAQVWLRVLGPDPEADLPLFNKMPGYATLNFRGGYRLSESSSITVIIENILDKNYRTMGSGVDAPGFNAVVRYSFRF